MNLTSYITIVLLLCISLQTRGQDGRLDKLRKLGRDSLIIRAKAKLLNEYPDFDFDVFSRVRVMTGEKLLYVEFSVPFKLVPLNSAANYNLTVHLYGPGLFSYSTLKNQAASGIDTEFYKPGDDDGRIIQFLIDAALQDGNVTSIDKAVTEFNDEVIIMEKENAYAVSISSPAVTGGYSVDKKSGLIRDKWHKHKRPVESIVHEIKE